MSRRLTVAATAVAGLALTALAACAPTVGGGLPGVGPAAFAESDFAWSQTPGPNAIQGQIAFAQDGKAARDFFYPYWHESMRRISAERGFATPNRISYESQAARGGAYFVGEPEQIAERIVIS